MSGEDTAHYEQNGASRQKRMEIKMKKTGIVIAQTYRDSLDEIRKELGVAKGLDVKYVSTPPEAVKLGSDPKAQILITGQCFYGSDNKTSMDGLMVLLPGVAMNLARDSIARFGNLLDGNDIARAVRLENPEIVVFRYSVMPESKDYLCGDIEKFSTRNISNLLTNVDFHQALRKKL